jgi:NDP-sugar pyrophosphorylase family protein
MSHLDRNINRIRTFAEEGTVPEGRPRCWAAYRRIRDALRDVVEFRGDDVFVSENAVINGRVWIDDGAEVYPGAYVEGPSYIGKDAVVGTGSLIRGETLIGDRSVVGSHCSTARSLIGPDTGVYTHCKILNSVVGRRCHLAGFTVTAASRIDLSPVVPEPDIEGVETIRKRGSIIHHGTGIGPFVVTLPDTILGENCFVESFIPVRSDVPAGTKLRNETPVGRERNDLEGVENPHPPEYPFKDG